MNITSKSRYGMKIVLDLAFYQASGLVKRSDIAKRQGIPSKYLDQIMIGLRSEGIVESIRGREGGYKLAIDPNELSVWDVFCSVEDNFFLPVECSEDHSGCVYEPSCVSSDVWKKVFLKMKVAMSGLTIASF